MYAVIGSVVGPEFNRAQLNAEIVFIVGPSEFRIFKNTMIKA